MILDIILWVLFGALAGWIASMIMGTNEEQGGFGNIVVGVAGAIIGGWVVRATTGNTVTGFNLGSLLVAILGAIILLAIYRMFRGSRRGTTHRA